MTYNYYVKRETCETCKYYREWVEYGEEHSDCFYNDVNHVGWFLRRTDEITNEEKNWKEVAQECLKYTECRESATDRQTREEEQGSAT